MANSNDEPPQSTQGFEQRLQQLESYLEELERGELPLEEAMRKYEAAVAELRHCYKLVAAAEEKVEALIAGANGEPRVAPLEGPLADQQDEDET